MEVVGLVPMAFERVEETKKNLLAWEMKTLLVARRDLLLYRRSFWPLSSREVSVAGSMSCKYLYAVSVAETCHKQSLLLY